MPVQPEQEEENWDDDYEFGSSAGSPVLGSQPRGGNVTPPNLSLSARRRSTKSPGGDSKREGRNRWSSGSFEDWDDQDETINVKGFVQQQQQPPSTPKQRSPKANYRTPTRSPRISNESEPFWDDDEDVDIARSAGVMPAFPSTGFGPAFSTTNSIFSPNLSTQSPITQPPSNGIQPPALAASGSKAPFPSVFKDANGSTTDTSISGHFESDQPSDTSASVSQSSSFFGRLGRRLSKAKPPNGMISPSTTERDLHSSGIFSPSVTSPFSPPTSSGSLAPTSNGTGFVAGHSPSKSRTFNFGSGILKRNGSLSRSSQGHQPSESTSKVPPLPKKTTPNSTPGSEAITESTSRFGLGVHLPESIVNQGSRTAPAVFNAARYNERGVNPNPTQSQSQTPSSSHLQYSSHIHSQSLAGLGLIGGGKMGYGMGGPPSPTGRKGKQDAGMLGSMKLPEKQRVVSRDKDEGTKGSTQPTHQSSLSTSSAFFSSIRRRSNPLQPANKVPNSAKTIPASTSATPRNASTPPSTIVAAEDELYDTIRKGLPSSNSAVQLQSSQPQIQSPQAQTQSPQAQIQSMTQAQIHAQAQAQRQRRSHRRNVSAGAMITSVIDEVSSDGTVSNKLSAIRDRDRAPPKSGLRESTTASEIRRGALDVENPSGDEAGRLSTSSERSTGSMSRVVSPIEFSRSSEESNAGFNFKASGFVFPRSMNIRSPLLSSEDRREETVQEEPTNTLKKSTSKGLLPPIELCPPSPPEVQQLKPSISNLSRDLKSKFKEKEPSSSSSSLTDGDADATPMALPRRRHQIQPSTGTVVQSNYLGSSTAGEQRPDEFSAGLSASVSAPGSMASANSNRTLAPKNTGVNKHHEVATGRTSPGISASLGRLAGSSTAEGIKESTSSGGGAVARRNSLTGGTTKATLSNSGSFGGGLKIPARISMKQDALKRDLNAVREFASSINDLKRLQTSYQLAVKTVSDLAKPTTNSESPSKRLYKLRAASPTPQFHIPRPPSLIDPESQPSSPTSPTFDKSFFSQPSRQAIVHKVQVPEWAPDPDDDPAAGIPDEQKLTASASLAELDSHYAIWWECADLLVELGSAAPPAVAGTPVKSPTMASLQREAMANEHSTPKPKERHATLPRHEPPPVFPHTMAHSPSSSDPAATFNPRRGSTGQSDLNPRQLQLLKGMLTTPNPNDLSSSVNVHPFYTPPTSTLSPVISHPSSSVRSALNFETPLPPARQAYLTDDEEMANEKEEKRNRRISMRGRLGVKEILASLKRTKEKVMRQKTRSQSIAPEEAGRSSMDYAAASRSSIDQSRSVSQAPPSPRAGLSRENLNVTSTAQNGAPPSPYKRNRRRSLASIFKFGNSSAVQNEDKMLSYSRSRIDLASPTPGEDPTSRHGGLRVDDSGTTDIDSDWDHMNSPSDIPGRYKTLQRNMSSSQDLSSSALSNRGRSAPVGVPISTSDRRGTSIVSRNTSTSRHAYTSASASAASLVSSSVYGSAASHQSLHEAFGGRGMADKSDDERRRLKKPTKPPRRAPSAGKRSMHTSSQTSLTSQMIGVTPPGVTSPIMDNAYRSTRSTSYQSQGTSLSNHSTSIHSSYERRRTPSTSNVSSPTLALTPENIVPLLVYAREVKLKLQECITEVKLVETDLLLSKAGVDDEDLSTRI